MSETNRLINQTWKTPAEVAERLGVSPATLANWRSAGRGPAYLRIGGRVVYPEKAIEQWLEAQLINPREELHHAHHATRPHLVLAPSDRRSGLPRQHRFGRYRTKREAGKEDR